MKRAERAATIMSPAIARLNPPPAATPLTATTIGTRHSRIALHEPPFGRRFDAHFATSLASAVPGTVYVAPLALWEELQGIVASEGFAARPLGAPHHGRQVFDVRPVSGPRDRAILGSSSVR